LASFRKNTRQNPDAKQTVPVSDPEKILRQRGVFKQNVVAYQPKYNQSKYKNFFKHSLIHMDIGGHPPFPTGSKQLSDIFGNLLFLAVFTSGAILRA
jgi:hypothetical protein